MASETVTCTGQQACPTTVGGTAPNCAWPRKLCVSCLEESNKVYIRIQSNGLPDHCYGGPPAVIQTQYDVKMVFDGASDLYTTKTFADQDAFDTFACNNARGTATNIQSASDFTVVTSDATNSAFLSGIAGWSINGIPIFTGASAEKTDPYYPQEWTDSSNTAVESVDACIGHPQGTGLYHYHMLPPCLVNAANIDTKTVCNSVSACTDDLKGYALSAYTATSKQITILGIAKDGHKIIGPYDDSGELINCSTLDVCNGMTLDGSYVYVYTNTFPYTVGCFGPG